ncbi:hypothetical protein MTO96_029144 [Rhipicephalus appendiculatus]
MERPTRSSWTDALTSSSASRSSFRCDRTTGTSTEDLLLQYKSPVSGCITSEDDSGGCSNGTVLAVFDMPFTDYATVYLVGCSLSLLAFGVEVTYQRYFYAGRLEGSAPARVIRHR